MLPTPSLIIVISTVRAESILDRFGEEKVGSHVGVGLNFDIGIMIGFEIAKDDDKTMQRKRKAFNMFFMGIEF